MVANRQTPLTGRRVVDELRKCGITHIVWLPDYYTGFMYEAMTSQSEIALVPACREGEAVAIAAGLILGGKRPVVICQNTGFYESGDSIRCVSLELRLPLFMIVGYRGREPDSTITDSAGIILEPTLHAWGIKYYLLESDKKVERITIGYKEAQETNKPVAILIVRGHD